jgi:UPF0755 protein
MKRLAFMVFLILAGSYPFWTPLSAPEQVVAEIREGYGVSQIGDELVRKGIVRTSFGFGLLTRALNKSTELKAGRYLFENPTPAWEVVRRLAEADYGTQQYKVTIPEGYTNVQISSLLGKELGTEDQGYLFPDTYYFDELATAEEIRGVMKDNFKVKVGTTSHEVVVMASILEKEVPDQESMRIVAGILYKRLSIDMPLQVDAVPSTYQERGLPNTPISNPGLLAIEAAQNPTPSRYLYYLSGTDGRTHYARTFGEHKLNKSRYLR